MQPGQHSSLPNAVVHPTLLHDEDLPVRGASSASSTSKGQTRGANMSSSQHASAPEPGFGGSAATNLNSGDCVRGADYTSDVASGLNNRSVSGEATITSFSANANRQESPPYYYTSGGTRTKTNKSMNGFGENHMQSMAGAASDDYDIDDNFDDHGNQVGVGMRKTKSILKNATPAKGAGGRKSGHGPSQLRCTPPSVLWRDEECSSRDLDSVQEVDSYKDINRRLFQGQQTGGGGCCTLM